MKRLITDVYNLAYRVTKAEKSSFIFALLCVSGLNFIVVYGLSVLLEGWMPTKMLHVIFVFPYYLITAFIILLINILIVAPSKKLRKRFKNKPVSIPPIIVYAAIALVIFLYLFCIKRF